MQIPKIPQCNHRSPNPLRGSCKLAESYEFHFVELLMHHKVNLKENSTGICDFSISNIMPWSVKYWHWRCQCSYRAKLSMSKQLTETPEHLLTNSSLVCSEGTAADCCRYKTVNTEISTTAVLVFNPAVVPAVSLFHHSSEPEDDRSASAAFCWNRK